MELVVGRVGRAHGVRGEVSVEVRTDDVERRFAVGSVLASRTRDGESGPSLTVAQSRPHSGRLLVAFEEIHDRDTAESLRGSLLVVDSETSVPVADDDEWWDHDIVGLDVVLVDGSPLGVVEDVLHVPGSDLLSVRRANGAEVLVPFVSAIVPKVDLEHRRLVVDPPAGLLELDEV
jgi:16S rRNA processing protein RimM